ncbi:hypothetical protein Pla175_49660 [Pirellulimonas nuda]|uniref:Uncharacterized protein n=1 Tax=Pirellulimonas nuda TaxID=2528009 RepID=A0A518DJ81_9BACT|nr:DUF1963 domain-containing protein [Pirellulimonas nuda]QDU91537.1 hypothetical protein Pla175_49660 [Pirellulimonas nuda]
MARLSREYQMLFSPGKPTSDELGERSKIGGMPDWIQDDDWPECPHCDEAMSFVGQLDSIEHESNTNPHSRPALSGD